MNRRKLVDNNWMNLSRSIFAACSQDETPWQYFFQPGYPFNAISLGDVSCPFDLSVACATMRFIQSFWCLG